MKLFIQSTNNRCFLTCVASILEVDPALVPNFCWSGREDWLVMVDEWLGPHGMAYVEVSMKEADPGLLGRWGYHIISGMGPRGALHAVVGYAGRMVHDPYPDGGGLIAPESDWLYGLFVALNPAEVSAATIDTGIESNL